MVIAAATVFLLWVICLLPNLAYASDPPSDAPRATVSVTASVPAGPSSFPILLDSVSGGGDFGQNSLIGFQITYGSNLTSSNNIIIETQWGQGTIENTTGSIDILDYALGTASPTDSGINPVVDLVNKKISWTIANFPGQTSGKKVYFGLKTLGNYTGSNKVNFSIKARIIGPGIITPDKIIQLSYHYNSNPPTSSSSNNYSSSQNYNQAPNSSPPPGSKTTSANPFYGPFTPGQIKFEGPTIPFRNIFIQSISDSDAKLLVELRDKLFSSVRFGISPKSLASGVNSLIKQQNHELTMQDLKPDTPYFFKVEAKDPTTGKIIGTETFIFKTATVSEKPQIDEDSLIASSGNNILQSPNDQETTQDSQEGVAKQKAKNIIAVPKEMPYEIRFKLKKTEVIKQVKVYLRPKNVLGISNVLAAEPTQDIVDLAEVEPGVYFGRLKSPPNPGYYEIIARIYDVKGNVVENKVAEVKVMKRFTVLEEKTNTPIDGARVLLYRFNDKTKIFEKISPQAIPIDNPSFSDSKGELLLILPNGKYKAEIYNIGFDDKQVEFTIGPSPDDGLPTVYLTRQPFNLFNIIRYYYRNIKEVFIPHTQNYFDNLAKSVRFFKVVALFSLGLMVGLSLISFSLRTHISIWAIPRFLRYQLKLFGKKSDLPKLISGKVLELESNVPIAQANLFILNNKNLIIDQTTTSRMGQFYLKLVASANQQILVIKKGYEPSSIITLSPDSEDSRELIINLKRAVSLNRTILENLRFVIESLIGFSFEVLVLGSVLFEILFLQTFGLSKTLPFAAVSLLNLILWFIYLKSSRRPV